MVFKQLSQREKLEMYKYTETHTLAYAPGYRRDVVETTVGSTRRENPSETNRALGAAFT